MRCLLLGVLALSTALATAADQPAESRSSLKPGNNLPGAFHPFNVTGPHKGRFHCLVSDYGLEPVVMLVVRDLDASDSLKELLKQLDEHIEKNPTVRLHAFAVFISEELPDAVTADDKREELVKKIEDLANALMLKNVVLGLDSKKDLEKYGLDDGAFATAILYSKYRIVALHVLPKGDAKTAVDKILADVAEKLKPARGK